MRQQPFLKTVFIVFLFLIPLLSLSATTSSTPEFDPNIIPIAIIIDDVGNHLARGKRAADLPGAVTLAVLPHTPNSVLLAERGHRNGKEIMLHAPMSNIEHRPLGPGALTADMNQGSFARSLIDSLDAVPHVSGVNNHMGSLLTQQENHMRWLMQVLRQKGLYFVDSRTTADTVAQRVAVEERIPNIKRDNFLDNEQDIASIRKQFQLFLRDAQKIGYAVAIAHPYPETLLFLETELPSLPQNRFKLVKVSELLAITGSHPNLPTPTPIKSSQSLDGPSHYIDPSHHQKQHKNQ